MHAIRSVTAIPLPDRMKKTSHSMVPDNAATRHLSEDKRRALELDARAPHETGPKRERLLREAKHKAGR